MGQHFLKAIITRIALVAGIVLCAVGAVQANAPERPVVFVPGITGSVLSDADGEVVWGDLGSLRGSNFHKMNLLPLEGEPLPMQPTDALRDVPLLFGTIEVGLYSGLIDFLAGKQSLRDRISGNPFKGEYVEGENLFVFAYDWRRSNFANALALDAFITENIPEGEFDLIAHSMGGLVTRIMLSKQGPNPLCITGSAADAELNDADYQALCNAIYGPAPSGSYPSDHLNAPRASADRLHTFIEMAVPHYGSVNLAATLLEGWGKVSELLLGGKLAIQNTVLSMAAPVELLPTYDKCCALGKAYASGNVEIEPDNEEYWLDLLLGFGVEPCPYDRCDIRRALFRNGMANRKIIDGIMDNGLPASVKANHGIIGRSVKNTRETVYVDFRAPGNGEGISYRTVSEGDGTVHRISALLPKNQQGDTFTNIAVVHRASHPFIVGDEGATTYVFDMLIDPIDKPIQAVSRDILPFAAGEVGELGLQVTEQVVLVGDSAQITLRLTQDDKEPFDPDLVREDAVRAIMRDATAVEGGEPIATLSVDEDRSELSDGIVVLVGDTGALATPGVYTLAMTSSEGVELAKGNLYVLEPEQ